jgi:carboxypeptidase T
VRGSQLGYWERRLFPLPDRGARMPKQAINTPKQALSIAVSYREIEETIKRWQREYPSLVRVQSLGRTGEGRAIPLLRLGREKIGRDTPEILLMAGIHPREQQPLVCLLKFVEELLAKPELLEGKLLWIILVFNVDGKLYDDAGTGREPRDWRKNRRKNGDAEKSVGVDLNRNFGVRWGGFREIDPTWRVPTTQPSANIYEGTAPFSEPETRALAKFIRSRKNLRAFLDIHSPLREIVHPAYLIAQEAARFTRMTKGMQARQHDRPYPITEPKVGQDAPVGVRVGNTGLAYTWAYYTLGVYSFNFEISLPSKTTGLSGRYPTMKDILNEYETNVREPLLYFCEESVTLPPAQAVRRSLKGNWHITPAPTPGAVISLYPPEGDKTTGFGVLVCERPEAVVESEYRLFPFSSSFSSSSGPNNQEGFTVTVQKIVRPGTKIPFILYLWDEKRQCSQHRFEILVIGRE